MRKIITIAIISMPLLIGKMYSQQNWDTDGNSISGGDFIGTTNNQDFLLFSNGQEGLRVRANGDVGIDQTNTTGKLHVLGRTTDTILVLEGVSGSHTVDFMHWKKSNTKLGVINTDGNVGIGDATPAQLLTVGSGDKFQVDNNGDMVKIKNVTYSWPTTQGAASSVLTNNGSGTLSWAAPGSVSSAWTITGNAGTSPGTNFIGTTDNTDWVIKTNNTEQIRVKADGNIGIGTTSPQVRLNLSAASKIRIGLTSSSEYLTMGANDIQFNRDNISYISNTNTGSNSKLAFTTQGGSANIRMLIDASGNVGVATTAPSSKLEVSGEVEIATLPTKDVDDVAVFYDASGGTGGSTKLTKDGSSIKYKQNIQNLSLYKDSILKLRPVQFQWKNSSSNKYDVGLIAEEVEKTMPNLVYYMHPLDTVTIDTTQAIIYDTTKLNLEGVHYHKLPVYLLAIIQEQEQRITQLETVVNDCCNRPQNRQGNSTEGNDEEQKGNENKKAVFVELETLDRVILYQNIPNPFGEETTIKYYIPESVQNASMIFYDSMGRAIKETVLEQKGNGALTIGSAKLANGIYSYSLVVDGKVIDTLKMQKIK